MKFLFEMTSEELAGEIREMEREVERFQAGTLQRRWAEENLAYARSLQRRLPSEPVS